MIKVTKRDKFTLISVLNNKGYLDFKDKEWFKIACDIAYEDKDKPVFIDGLLIPCGEMGLGKSYYGRFLYGRWRWTNDWLCSKNKNKNVLEIEYTDFDNTNGQTQYDVRQLADTIMLDYIKNEMTNPNLIFALLMRTKEFEVDSMYWQEHVDDIECSDYLY